MSQRARAKPPAKVAWSKVIPFATGLGIGLAILAAASAQMAQAAELPSSQPPAGNDAAGTSSAAADAQNPIAHVISIPLQENLYTSVGPYDKTANTLLLQPVIPFKLDNDWSLVTRTIIPVIHQPATSPEQDGATGLGNIEPQFYFTPAHPGKVIWGAGAQLWLPTASDDALGHNSLGAGPTFVALTVQGHWVVGALVNNVWAGTGPRRVNLFTLNPFANYNLRQGWYLASTPVITSNWVKPSSDRWTVPLGGGFGRIFTFEGLHLNTRFEVFRNVARPDNAALTQVQFQLQMLFPEKH